MLTVYSPQHSFSKLILCSFWTTYVQYFRMLVSPVYNSTCSLVYQVYRCMSAQDCVTLLKLHSTASLTLPHVVPVCGSLVLSVPCPPLLPCPSPHPHPAGPCLWMHTWTSWLGQTRMRRRWKWRWRHPPHLSPQRYVHMYVSTYTYIHTYVCTHLHMYVHMHIHTVLPGLLEYGLCTYDVMWMCMWWSGVEWGVVGQGGVR